MKKILIATTMILAMAATPVKAFDLSSLLGNAGSAVSGVVEGLLTKTDITVEQMAGTWTSTGSAVCFQSENFLQKAGGSAAAGTIESKLNPYYEKFGLTGAVLTVETDGSFTLKIKSINLKGTITKRDDGNFDFTFTPFGNIKMGAVKTYVEKPMGGLNVMFDATKLKTLISAVAKFTGNSLASTAGNLLDSYEGLCVGFAFKGQGTGNSTGTGTGSGAAGGIGDLLKGVLGK